MMTQPATGRAARLEDVAALAGVSTATASKALHNKPRISEETKQRVLDAAKQLNYSPNKLAQSLARGTTALSAWSPPICRVVSPHRFLSARRTSCEPNRPQYCWPTLVATPPWNVSMSRNCCPSRSTDCSSCSARPTPRPTLGHDWGVPLVYVYGPSTDPKDCSVTCDNVDAGRMAINHLISCGRRHIAIIGGDETYTAATDRTKGALEALAELGIEPAGPIRYGKWDEGWGRAATRLLLDQGVKFDASGLPERSVGPRLH